MAAPSPLPSVSVVVCAYTPARWDDIVTLVDALEAQAPHEVVLVIDHHDELLARARARWPQHRVVPNAHRQGLSGARNTGVEAATGDLVAFVDDDACPEPGWLAALAATFADERVIGAGGRVDPAWDEGRPAWFPPEFDWVVGCSYRGLPDERRDVRNPIGANMAFRRAVFGAVGGFDDGVGRVGADATGCEETEFCIRAATATGGRIVYEPAAVVRHRVPASRANVRYFLRRCRAEGGSKAVVARLAGADQALATERSYTTRTLPAGVVDGLRAAVRERNPAVAGRAGLIVAGLAVTTYGYARGRLRRST